MPLDDKPNEGIDLMAELKKALEARSKPMDPELAQASSKAVDGLLREQIKAPVSADRAPEACKHGTRWPHECRECEEELRLRLLNPERHLPAPMESPASSASAINQCDGCRRGLPLRANGIHYEDKPFPHASAVMACTKDRYVASAIRPISTIPLLKRLREQRDEIAEVLRWLDARGGLGHDAHERIRKALENVPSYEQQLRNVADGIGMTYEELIVALNARAEQASHD